MGLIDIGPGATDRADVSNAGSTKIDKGNAANDTGKLTSGEIWFNTNGSGVKLGVASGSGTTYSCNDYASIGNVTAGSKQTFTGLDIDVTSGNFLAMYWSGGNLERDTTGGADFYYKAGDQFGAGAQTHTQVTGDALSMYATGTTGWANIIAINGIASADISTVNGIAVADIAEINGVAV